MSRPKLNFFLFAILRQDFFVWVGILFYFSEPDIRYRHQLWKDYENSEYTGTSLKQGTDRNENFEKKPYSKTAIKSFVSRGFFWVGRLTANKQYFNLGLIHPHTFS